MADVPTERLHSDYALDLPRLKTYILDKDRKQSNQSHAVGVDLYFVS